MKLDSVKSKLLFFLSDKYFILTLIACVFLVIFKFEYFYLPYFSDELWVYGPALRKMGETGPSMIPTSLGLEDHWGHPLFFFFIGGIWCSIFGTSLFSTHLFAAFISTLLLVTIYFIGKNIFNKRVGFYTVLLFACQSIFLGQFSLVLPEVLLTLLIFLTIYFSSKENKLWYLLMGSCLVLTKETGVFAIAAIVCWNIIKFVVYEKDDFSFKEFIKSNLILSLPIIFLLIHFLLLKMSYGWFIMPIRMDAFDFSWEIYRERIMHTIHYVFVDQGRKPVIIILFVLAILFNKRFLLWQRIAILVIAFSMMKVFFKYWDLPEFVSYLIIPALFIVMLKIVFLDTYKENKKQGNVIAVYSIFIVFYLLFSSSQFNSLRYSLCLIPMFIMISIYFFDQLSSLSKFILPSLVGISMAFSIIFILNNTQVNDDNNNYKDMCFVRSESVNFLEEKKYYSRKIYAPFLFRHTIERPLVGYLKSTKFFTNVYPVSLKNSECNECICIFESKDLSEFYQKITRDEKFELINKSQKGSVWIEIYAKKQKL